MDDYVSSQWMVSENDRTLVACFLGPISLKRENGRISSARMYVTCRRGSVRPQQVYKGWQKRLAVFPQTCLCKRVVLVVFVASVHARALFTREHVFDLLFFVFRRS